MDKAQEKIGDDIYASLKEIEKEEEVKLSDRAFIADCLSQKLIKLGYRKPLDRPKLREALAELEHDQWVKWSMEVAQSENISGDRLIRWRNMWVSYDKLPEDVKNQDRVWADKSLALIVPKDKPPLLDELRLWSILEDEKAKPHRSIILALKQARDEQRELVIKHYERGCFSG